MTSPTSGFFVDIFPYLQTTTMALEPSTTDQISSTHPQGSINIEHKILTENNLKSSDFDTRSINKNLSSLQHGTATRPISSQQHLPRQYLTEQEINVKQQRLEETPHSCPSCLWAGVITCSGLALYFGHLAHEEFVVAQVNQNKSIGNTPNGFWNLARRLPPRNSLVFGGISFAWVVAGIYRYHLG